MFFFYFQCTCVDTSHVAVAPAELVGANLDPGESEVRMEQYLMNIG